MRIRPEMIVLLTVGTVAACAPVRTPPPGPQAQVWVCHGGRNPRWQRVAAAAADAHRRHGDRLSEQPQEAGTRCSQ